MKYGSGEAAVYLCNFCGRSSWGRTHLFVSEFDGVSAICQCCRDGDGHGQPVNPGQGVQPGTLVSMTPRDTAPTAPTGPVVVAASPARPQRVGLRGVLGSLGELLVRFAGQP